jgi:hypothetical protein
MDRSIDRSRDRNMDDRRDSSRDRNRESSRINMCAKRSNMDMEGFFFLPLKMMIYF